MKSRTVIDQVLMDTEDSNRCYRIVHDQSSGRGQSKKWHLAADVRIRLFCFLPVDLGRHFVKFTLVSAEVCDDCFLESILNFLINFQTIKFLISQKIVNKY